MRVAGKMKSSLELSIFEGHQQLCAAAADLFAAEMEKAVRGRGRFCVALSGGRTPGLLYSDIAGRRIASAFWKATHIFFADERYLPPGNVETNMALLERTLLSGGKASQCNVHAFDTALPSPQAAATEYGARLSILFGDSIGGRPWEKGPLFDLVLLGLGADGHTASLFRSSPALLETRRAAVAVDAPEGVSPALRMTLTPPLLRAGRRTLFLVSGPEKHEALTVLLSGKGECPALSAISGSGAAVYADGGAING